MRYRLNQKLSHNGTTYPPRREGGSGGCPNGVQDDSTIARRTVIESRVGTEDPSIIRAAGRPSCNTWQRLCSLSGGATGPYTSLHGTAPTHSGCCLSGLQWVA